MAGENFAGQAQRADVQRRLRVGGIDGGVHQEAIRAHRSDQRDAGGIDIVMVHMGEVAVGPFLQCGGVGAVVVFEERPVEEGFVGHQIPRDEGRCECAMPDLERAVRPIKAMQFRRTCASREVAQ